MANISKRVVSQLKEHKLAGLDAGKDVVYPYYNGGSISNLPASICQLFQIPSLPGTSAVQKDFIPQISSSYQHIILLVVDGLGLEWLEQMTASPSRKPGTAYHVWQNLEPHANFSALTSVVPSTTASALNTLWTGKSPAEHGVLGYEMWLKEYGILSNMIALNPAAFKSDVGALKKAGFQPEEFLPVPTLGPHMTGQSIQVFAYLHYAIANSGLSQMHLKDAKIIPYHSVNDMWISLTENLQAQSNNKTYHYLYWGGVDEFAHHFGINSSRLEAEFDNFCFQLDYFMAKLNQNKNGKTLLIITADHGHLDTPANPSYELINHPELKQCLVMPPSCENRLPYLFVRFGYDQQLKQYIDKQWPNQFRVIPSQTVLEAGLFGNPPFYKRVAERIGDYVVIPQNNAYWWWAEKENFLRSRHGGLSASEMLVPLILFEL